MQMKIKMERSAKHLNKRADYLEWAGPGNRGGTFLLVSPACSVFSKVSITGKTG